jgi:uncharacterized SAM-binding protein YcdF (DUF218 family)
MRQATALSVAAGVLVAGPALGAGLLAHCVRRAELAASAPVREPADLFAGDPGAPPAADALVVFGAAAAASGPSPELRSRLDHALRLWRIGAAPVVMVSGGVTGDIDEVEVMTRYLVGRGVPEDVVIPARPGDNTRASLQALARLGDRRYVAVSSPYHAFRIRSEARRQHVRVTVSTPPSTPETRHRATHRAALACELAAVLWYLLPAAWARRLDTGPGTLRHVLPRVLSGRQCPRALIVCPRRSS